MLLCIDIGNTNIVVAGIINKKIHFLSRFETNRAYSTRQLGTKLVQLVETNHKGAVLEDIIISSVVPSLDEVMMEIGKQYFNKIPMFVTPNTKTNLTIKIECPSELGSDLLVDGVSAYNKYRCNVIVVDLGTATKFIVVNENKELLGGAIAPGVITSLKGLFSSAEKLKEIDLSAPKQVIGNSTITCLESGSIYGTASMLEGMITRMKEELPNSKVVITGGIAPLIIPHLRIEFEYDENLLIEGLINIYYKSYN